MSFYTMNDITIPGNYNVECGFKLDEFQKNGAFIIDSKQNFNIVVTACTGSGKTFIGEYAIKHYAELGKKIIYTSPVKALSNQKYYNFRKKFPDYTFGLMTGDHKVNPDATCIIMTTEILAKTIKYTTGTSDEVGRIMNITEVNLSDVACVIFDEAHFLFDENRGSVWESCISGLPKNINQVLLSATLKNPHGLGYWISTINGVDTYLLESYHRNVPLHFNALYIMNDSVKKKINKDPQVGQLIGSVEQLHELTNTNIQTVTMDKYNEMEKINNRLYELKLLHRQPSAKSLVMETIMKLKADELLPCICFILSKQTINQMMEGCPLILNSVQEQTNAVKVFNEYLGMMVVNKDDPFINGKILETMNNISKGYACHHAGMLPILKDITELMYNDGYIKVLFATETFSVGLDMPTRTVVLTSLTKHDGSKYRMFKPDEFIQMNGRAGRRGKDIKGTVVYLPQFEKKFISRSDLSKLLIASPTNDRSKFIIDPKYVLKSIYHEQDIDTECSKTLWKLQIDSQKNNDLDILNKMDIEMANIKKELLDEDIEIFNKIEQIKSYGSMYKNGNKEINTLKEKLSKEFNPLHNMWLQYTDLKRDSDILRKKMSIDEISCSTGGSLEFLKKYGYIKENNTPDTNKEDIIKKLCLTDLGKYAVYLSEESHTLLLARILQDDAVKSLTKNDIILLLAFFVSQTSDGFNSINGVSKELNDILIKYNSINDDMAMCLENKHFNLGNEWYISTTYIEIVDMWLKGKSFVEIATYMYNNYEYVLYEGDFIKGILKLSKICESVYTLMVLENKPYIATHLEGVDQILLKGIVRTDCIYIEMK